VNGLGRRVVVTGIGLSTPVGETTAATWSSIQEGAIGIDRITAFDASQFACHIAGEVKGFDATRFMEKKEARKMGRFIHFAIAAADEAVKQSGVQCTDENAERVGVYIGSGIGGFEIIEREHQALIDGGPRRISPFFIPATIVNLASGQVSIRIGAKGPNSAVATACTTGAHAIGDSFKIIQRGDADIMVCGGAEAAITPMGIGGFAAMRALSTRNDDPKRASRPWDKDRDGFVVGEGAGILVLEDLESARRRGAEILAEMVGYGMSGDAYHMTSPPADGEGAFRVMRNALRDAGLNPEQIGYINAHGTSTEVGDRIEVEAIKRCFGDHAYKLCVSSTKSMTGHLLGGAGGIEAGFTVLALRHQILPPTMNLEHPDEGCDLDFVPNQARQANIEYALSNSFGFGGTNGSIIFRKF
jgi:3-oxoacyl-[acyl-carrier-protein] synthase II